MRKLRALIGMPVVVRSRRVGRLIQAELSGDLTRMEGIWVDAGLRGTRLIPSESLQMIGRVAVVADDAGVRKKCTSPALFRRAVGTDGRRLGAITGAQINDLSFRIEGLELSFGIWDDLLYGRIFVRRFTTNPASGDVLVDIAENEKEVEGHEERNDEGTGDRSTDRRFCRNDLRHHELAVCPQDEPAGPQNG